jgi:hypothetical protein
LENEALSANQREWTKIRKEVEELRSIRDDLDVLRADNKRYLERVFIPPCLSLLSDVFRYKTWKLNSR